MYLVFVVGVKFLSKLLKGCIDFIRTLLWGVASRDRSNYKDQCFFFSFFISKGWHFKQATLPIIRIIVICNWIFTFKQIVACQGGSVGSECASDWWSECCGLDPAGSATFFHWELSQNIFYLYSSHSTDSRMAVVTFWQKNDHITG